MQVAPGESLWAVLMRESVFGPKRLELFHTYADYSSGPVYFVLDLSDMLHVEKDLEATLVNPKLFLPNACSGDKLGLTSSSISPQQWQFTISTKEKTHRFATRTGEESSHWVGKLNELLHGPPEHGIECEFHSVNNNKSDQRHHAIMLPKSHLSQY